MGYYYDWLERKWLPKSAVKLTPEQQSRRKFRRDLIADLLLEIENGGDGVACLYATLLAHTLIATDEDLMGDYGQCVAELSEDVDRSTSSNRH